MRRSSVKLAPTAVALQVASLVVIAIGLAWILIDNIRHPDPVTARAEPPAQSERGALQR
jgi:hypothetical protein